MCLSIPAKIKSIDQLEATVTVGKTTYTAQLDLVPDAKIDDYVLIHSGYALQKIDEDEARRTLEFLIFDD
jgi:hydrogenase expression/formation protein HypC